MPDCTNKRFAQTQVWPALRYLEAIAPSTASSISASSKMINGAFPPSSSDIFLIVSADWRMRMRPTSVEPVNVNLRTRLSSHITEPKAGASRPGMIFMIPAGMPARCANSARARADNGVCSAGFRTQAQPTAMPGATLRVIIAFGKFHGVTAPNTPTGWRKVKNFLSAKGLSNTSPCTRFACSANHSIKLEPYPISPLASARGLPISAVRIMARSSAFSMQRSYHLRKICERSLAVLAAQFFCAISAASIACAIMSAPQSATCAITVPSTGLVTSKVLPDVDFTN